MSMAVHGIPKVSIFMGRDYPKKSEGTGSKIAKNTLGGHIAQIFHSLAMYVKEAIPFVCWGTAKTSVHRKVS